MPKKGVPMDAEELKERLRLYERVRDELATSARSMSESYDRALLTLSSAFLGGSLAFIGEVVDLETAIFKGLLYSAWVAFAVTIILTLWSFVYGFLQFQPLRDAAERYYMKGDQEAWKESEKVQREVLRFTVAGGVLFIIGIVLLIAFVSLNLAKG